MLDVNDEQTCPFVRFINVDVMYVLGRQRTTNQNNFFALITQKRSNALRSA